MDKPTEKVVIPKDAPHKAVVRIVAQLFPLRPDGELHPSPSDQKVEILDIIYGKTLEECQLLVEASLEKWKKQTKAES